MANERITIIDNETRSLAAAAIHAAPQGAVVNIRTGSKRTIEQNAAMWGGLTDLSKQVDWYSNKLSPEEWKIVLTASLKIQRVVPGIDGGFVAIGQSTSQMTIAEMSEMIELIYAFGTQHGVKFTTSREDC